MEGGGSNVVYSRTKERFTEARVIQVKRLPVANESRKLDKVCIEKYWHGAWPMRGVMR